MGILSNTVSICQFRVEGEIPAAAELFAWASDLLARHRFQPIDQGAAELSVGWVHTGNHQESAFASPADFWHDHYLAFSLRQDRRRIPAALLKAYFQVSEHEFLAANPGLRWVPKQKKQDLRDNVRAALLAKTLPVPVVLDAVWDTRTGLLTFTALGRPAIEAFETHFKKTFPALRLIAVHPYARAWRVVDGPQQAALRTFNKATTESALDLSCEIFEASARRLVKAHHDRYKLAVFAPLGQGEQCRAELGIGRGRLGRHGRWRYVARSDQTLRQ